MGASATTGSMKQVRVLVVMTLLAVLSDYLLHPFYPHLFRERFGVEDPRAVGYYFTALCGAVMVAFPLWAYLSRRVPVLRMLVITQGLAGLLALGCYLTADYAQFWALSLVMVLCKGSYLLVYPYALQLCPEHKHATLIGTLTVMVHLGGILGAVVGGYVLEAITLRSAFIIMGVGDFVLMGLSIFLLYTTTPVPAASPEPTDARRSFLPLAIFKVGLVSLTVYFSDFLIRPFMVSYWEDIHPQGSPVVAALVYAIPGSMALFGLWLHHYRPPAGQEPLKLTGIWLLAAGAVLLQSLPSPWALIIGRVLYGWAIFQGTVRLDLLLIAESTPKTYATDYSKVHFFENLGVLLASFSTGLLVEHWGFQMPFLAAWGGLMLGMAIYLLAYRKQMRQALQRKSNLVPS